jgi:hypothetical protein
MRAHVALCLVLCLPSCGGVDPGKAAAVAIGVGAAVAAAAIERAATGDCWGSCRPGTYCDSSSGLCVSLPPNESVAAEPEAEWIACDHQAYQCLADLWLRCALPCEWVMCKGQQSGQGEPRRCCEQRCEWLICPEDGTPCQALGREPPKRDALAVGALDPCRGLCLQGERCVVRDGVADCLAAGK